MLRITLNKEAMLAASATLHSEVRGDNKVHRMQDVLRFAGRQIDVTKDGDVYLSDASLMYEMPCEFEPFVTEVSYYDSYAFQPRRQSGEYRLASAIGELEMTNDPSNYQLKLRAKNMKELRELFYLIRQGQIWPTKDYEQAQVPPPFRHLKDALAEIWQLIQRDIRDRLYRIKERVAH